MTRATSLAALFAAACVAQGATLDLVNLEIRENAGLGNAFAFFSPDNIVATVPDGGGTTSRSSVVEWTTDIDSNGGVDDVISFTVTGRSNTANNVSWGGIGWGAAGAIDGSDSITFSVSGVAITGGTAAGAPITFDGFTGGTAGAYAGGGTSELDGSVDINGQTVSRVFPVSGAFDFALESATFPGLASTVTLDNPQITTAVGFAGFQARGLDMQFTTIPEPATASMLAFVGIAALAGRRS